MLVRKVRRMSIIPMHTVLITWFGSIRFLDDHCVRTRFPNVRLSGVCASESVGIHPDDISRIKSRKSFSMRMMEDDILGSMFTSSATRTRRSQVRTPLVVYSRPPNIPLSSFGSSPHSHLGLSTGWPPVGTRVRASDSHVCRPPRIECHLYGEF